MPKLKTMTVNQLYNALYKLITQGDGLLPVCVDKDTFQDNRESDGCTILEVDGVLVHSIYLADDDGGIAKTKGGLEKTRRTVILYGTSCDPDKYDT